MPKLWSWTIWPPAHITIIIVMIKMISRAPIYCTGESTGHFTITCTHAPIHVCTHTHTHTHVSMAVKKDSLEIVIKQVHLEGGFKRGGRIRVAECLRQTVPNRGASIRK